MVAFNDVQRQLCLKALSTMASILLISSSIIQLAQLSGFYTQTLIALYNVAAACILLIAEHSPYVFENYIVEVLSFFKQRYGKPVFYLVIGSFGLDPENIMMS